MGVVLETEVEEEERQVRAAEPRKGKGVMSSRKQYTLIGYTPNGSQNKHAVVCNEVWRRKMLEISVLRELS